MGLVMAIRGERKWGVRTARRGPRVVPRVHAVDHPVRRTTAPSPFYEEFFPGFGHSMFAIVWTMIRHPSRIYRVAFLGDRMTYYRQLLLPVALLPVAAPLLLLIAGPQTVVNVVSLHSAHPRHPLPLRVDPHGGDLYRDRRGVRADSSTPWCGLESWPSRRCSRRRASVERRVVALADRARLRRPGSGRVPGAARGRSTRR